MDFLELAKARYSVRKFKRDRVEDDKIEKILEAGRVAPTAKNNQPQRILVFKGEEELEKYREITPCHYDATLAFAVGFDKDECFVRTYDGKSSGEVDASIVATHMMMEAWNLGIGSTWVAYFDPDVVREKLQVPENIEIVCLLSMGYASEDAKPSEKHIDRKEVNETVFYGKFD